MLCVKGRTALIVLHLFMLLYVGIADRFLMLCVAYSLSLILRCELPIVLPLILYCGLQIVLVLILYCVKRGAQRRISYSFAFTFCSQKLVILIINRFALCCVKKGAQRQVSYYFVLTFHSLKFNHMYMFSV